METREKFLVDTNIWLERLLDQDKSEIVSKFLDLVPANQIFVSDFTVHSIGVILTILTKLKKLDILDKIVTDLFIHGQVEQITLDTIDIFDIISNIEEFNLDFDDSYQLTVSQKFDLTLITFDKDFNVKGIKKKSPEEIIQAQ
ncbi:MAG: PIN domain-containing protein [Chlorobi bacterium]|nr:PIN domain-containing protein [Chlorobiota bacterium]